MSGRVSGGGTLVAASGVQCHQAAPLVIALRYAKQKASAPSELQERIFRRACAHRYEGLSELR